MDDFWEKFDIVTAPPPNLNEYFEISGRCSIRKRTLQLHQQAYVHPAPAKTLGEKNPGLTNVAKSWVRATLVTPEADFDPAATEKKLRALGTDVIEAASRKLQAKKMISSKNKGRAVPGRAYDLSEDFHAELKSQVPIETYREAISVKMHLDALFKEEKHASFPDEPSDGYMLAHLNMRARMQIRGVYKSASPSADSEALERGRSTLVPASAYAYGNPLQPLPPPPKPRSIFCDDGRVLELIPVWYDINGELSEHVWEKVLVSVVSHVHLNPGITLAVLQRRYFSSSLMMFDVQMVLDWMVEARVACWVLTADRHPQLSDWWWMFLG
jgi:hypothetical protein